MIFKNYKVKDLFNVESTKSLDAGKLQFIDNGINFVGRSGANNGIQGKIAKQSYEPNNANTISVSVIGYKYAFVQEEPYYCSPNIDKLTPLYSMSTGSLLYCATLVQKFLNKFQGARDGFKLKDLEDHTLILPIRTNTYHAIGYMKQVIKSEFGLTNQPINQSGVCRNGGRGGQYAE